MWFEYMKSQGYGTGKPFFSIRNHELFHLPADLFTGIKCLICRDIEQDDKEFLSSPADHPVFAAVALQDIGNAHKGHIPCVMAVCVIYTLKVINVHHGKHGFHCFFSTAAHVLQQIPHNVAAVIQSCQSIPVSHVVQFLHAAAQFPVLAVQFVLLLFLEKVGVDPGLQFRLHKWFLDIITCPH